MRGMYDDKTCERGCWFLKWLHACEAMWGGAGWGGVTCDNVEAVGGVQDLLQANHVGVLRQHAHDPHLLHDHDLLYDMQGRFPHLVLHSAGCHYAAAAHAANSGKCSWWQSTTSKAR